MLPLEGSRIEFTCPVRTVAVIAPKGRRFARNTWSASLHTRKLRQYTTGFAVVRPTE